MDPRRRRPLAGGNDVKRITKRIKIEIVEDGRVVAVVWTTE